MKGHPSETDRIGQQCGEHWAGQSWGIIQRYTFILMAVQDSIKCMELEDLSTNLLFFLDHPFFIVFFTSHFVSLASNFDLLNVRKSSIQMIKKTLRIYQSDQGRLTHTQITLSITSTSALVMDSTVGMPSTVRVSTPINSKFQRSKRVLLE